MAKEHPKELERKSEKTVLDAIPGSYKIGKKTCPSNVYEGCKNELSHLNGIGTSDCCIIIKAPNSICYLTFEVKGGKGDAKNGSISIQQIRLWKGEVLVIQTSLSKANWKYPFYVIPANDLIRAALKGEYIMGTHMTPIHQEDILRSASFGTIKPETSEDKYGCYMDELKSKIIEAQNKFERDEKCVKIVEDQIKEMKEKERKNKELGEWL